jgi:hypothetical protein
VFWFEIRVCLVFSLSGQTGPADRNRTLAVWSNQFNFGQGEAHAGGALCGHGLPPLVLQASEEERLEQAVQVPCQLPRQAQDQEGEVVRLMWLDLSQFIFSHTTHYSIYYLNIIYRTSRTCSQLRGVKLRGVVDEWKRFKEKTGKPGRHAACQQHHYRSD